MKRDELEDFDEQILTDTDPQTLLAESDGPLYAYSGYQLTTERDVDVDWRRCEVNSYNPDTRKFTITWEDGDKREVSRMNLRYEHEDHYCYIERIFRAKQKLFLKKAVRRYKKVLKGEVKDKKNQVLLSKKLMHDIYMKISSEGALANKSTEL